MTYQLTDIHVYLNIQYSDKIYLPELRKNGWEEKRDYNLF
jgi:hypothetical protein